ncbi:SPOR domain-containing protein [Pseudoroseomonas globiformis]|uniref:SPOR domain-containing protein n=1 Tax=Teichococcus globiformis TaxID=2307229 RepID=A0ABV7G018_9PROT
MAAGLIGTLAVGGFVGWAVTHYADNTIPVVAADARPIKVRPESRGGMQVANQDEIIFERRTVIGTQEASGRLGPAAEAPNLDALRAATTPPPSIVQPQHVERVPVAPQEVPYQAPVQQAPVQAAPIAPHSPAAAVPEAPLAPATPQQAARPAVPSPVVPSPVQPATMRTAGMVVVQLGALDSESGARSEWERLGRRIPELGSRTPQVIRFEREGRPTMWRLRTGGFTTREDAGEFCDVVKSRGGACAVIGG